MMNIYKNFSGTIKKSLSESNAMVLNGRHLQNLDSEISNVGKAASNPVAITGADIRSDIAWRDGEDSKDFENNYKNIGKTGTDDFSLYTGSESTAVQVYKYNNSTPKPEHKFYSIENATLKTVNGNENTLSNFDIVENDTDKNAGLFGSFAVTDSEISDLKLKNFTVTGTGSAGALCGFSKNTEITKVLAYHEAQTGPTYVPGKDSLITGKVSGGLVGTMDGGKIEQSAAAVFVKATGTAAADNAGGLVGTCTGTVNITDIADYDAGNYTIDILEAEDNDNYTFKQTTFKNNLTINKRTAEISNVNVESIVYASTNTIHITGDITRLRKHQHHTHHRRHNHNTIRIQLHRNNNRDNKRC